MQHKKRTGCAITTQEQGTSYCDIRTICSTVFNLFTRCVAHVSKMRILGMNQAQARIWPKSLLGELSHDHFGTSFFYSICRVNAVQKLQLLLQYLYGLVAAASTPEHILEQFSIELMDTHLLRAMIITNYSMGAVPMHEVRIFVAYEI